MSKLIIVCGIPASGKSTLADAISSRLNMFLLRKDSLIDGIMDISKVKTFEEYNKFNKIPVPLTFKLAEEQIKLGVDFILESSFCFKEDALVFQNWIKKYKIDFYCIICSIDEKARQERFAKRKEHYRKYFINDKIKNNSPVTFKNQGFDYNIMPNKKIYITTNRPVDDLVDEIIKLLK